MLKDKNVLHNIAKKVSFANLVEAHELVESGALPGNVVLRIE
jgi:NADPH2:quinone reductase